MPIYRKWKTGGRKKKKYRETECKKASFDRRDGSDKSDHSYRLKIIAMVKNAEALLGNLLEELRAKGFDTILEAAESDPALKEKICLMGEAVLYEAKRNPAVMEKLYVLLDRSLTKKEDRVLFGLPPRTPSASPDGPVAAPQGNAPATEDT